MANRFNNPFPEFYTTGVAPREGGRLFFYESGTSTKLDTYSDAALSVANENPIVLDENGRPEVAIFLKNQDYRVVLAAAVEVPGTDDPPTNIIWQADPVRASDHASFVIFKTGSGNPNGVVAGTGGSAGVLPTMYWDYTNSILYACTATGTTLTAVWTALNSTSAGSFFAPAGRLTLSSGVPVISSDVTGAGGIYYTPFEGNAVPIYNGSTFVMRTFSELFLELHSSHASGSIYDVYMFDDNGTLTLGTGPAWTTATIGAGARGAGAGTTQLSRVTGLHTNAVSMTARNGSTTYTVSANLGLYIGSAWINGGGAGLIDHHVTFGQNRECGLWNAFNRETIILKAGDSAASWTYSSATLRASNNASGNKFSSFCGLAEEWVEANFLQKWSVSGVAAANGQIAIGVNSTTTASGFGPSHAGTGVSGGATITLGVHLEAAYQLLPFLGINEFTCLEGSPAAANVSFFGTELNMLMTGRYRG